jgi:hypothetical protein
MAENPLFKPAVPLLKSRGFKKRGGAQIFARRLAPGINAWLGLNARSDPGRLSLSPTVGVRHELVQHWVTRLRDKDPRNDTAPTVSTGMGKLLPDGRHFPHWQLFKDAEEQNAATWELFGRDVDEFVVPWWEDRSSDEAIVAALRAGQGFDTGRLALPVLLWSMGRTEDAREAVEAGRHVRFEGGMVVDYEAYAARLLAEIDAHPDGPSA